MTKQTTTVLHRTGESLSVSGPTWANILLLASKSGWAPQRPTYFFLARDFEVNAAEADSLAQTVERIWSAASDDPFGFHLDPPVDLLLLMKVGAFAMKGPFIVS